MLPGPDWLASVYLGCFVFGLIFTLVSAFLSFGDLAGDLHLPHVGGANGTGSHIPHVHAPQGHTHAGRPHAHVAHTHTNGGHAPADHAGATVGPPVPTEPVDKGAARETVSWLNLPTLLAGIAWFGGVGTVLTNATALPWTWVLGLAVAGGFVGGYIVYFFFAHLLWPAQTPPMDPDEYDLRGTYARVVSGIGPGGVGEIMYTMGGARQVAGARSADGGALPKGTEVMVLRYERGLAYVLARDAVQESDLEDPGRITTHLPSNPAASVAPAPGDPATAPTRNL